MNAPPQNDRMEAGLIGAVLLTPSAAASIFANIDVRPDDFYNGPRRAIWQAMQQTVDQGHQPDRLTVLSRLGEVANAEGYLDEALQEPAGVGNIKAYAAEIQRLALRRAWQQAAYLMLQAAEENDETLVAQAEQTIAQPTVSDATSSAQQLADDAFEWTQNAEDPGSISTGFSNVDHAIGGLRPGDMSVVAGWTNMGKSPLADRILLDAARAGKRVHLYLNEMSKRDRTHRFVAQIAGVSVTRMQAKALRNAELSAYADGLAEFARLGIGMTDTSAWSVDQTCRHMRANRWDICCLDFLHNIPHEGEQELSKMIQTFNAAARSSEAHLLLVCQLNDKRAVSDVYPRPVLRDIRGSGMIRALAANAVFIHRQQVKNGNEIETPLETTLHWDMARHGVPCSAEAVFAPKWMSFLPDGDRQPHVASAPAPPASSWAAFKAETDRQAA